MKNLNVLYLILLMIMTVYAMPVEHNKRILLERIRDQAEIWMSKMKPGDNIHVRMITEDTNPCPKKFFCLAEAVLKETNGTKLPSSDVFTRNLLQYNKNVTCHLKTSGKYYLKQFLEKVIKCANSTLDSR